MRAPRLALLCFAVATTAGAAEIPKPLEAVMAADPACNILTAEDRREGSTTARLGDKALYVVLCDRAAYNTTSRLFVETAGEFEPLYFAVFDEDLGWTGTATLFGANYDAGTQVLTSSYAGRGLGDCGSAGRWRWSDGAFRMLEFRAWSDCDRGRAQKAWPVVYAAKPQRHQ